MESSTFTASPSKLITPLYATFSLSRNTRVKPVIEPPSLLQVGSRPADGLDQGGDLRAGDLLLGEYRVRADRLVAHLERHRGVGEATPLVDLDLLHHRDVRPDRTVVAVAEALHHLPVEGQHAPA